MLVCTNCRQGLMDPIRNEDEPEYTDRYQCGHCGHAATIPSLLIIFSQFISAILGGGITFYLLQHHGVRAFALLVSEGNSNLLLREGGLALGALTLVLAFIYLLYLSFRGISKRMRYRLPPQNAQ
ncbi:MULTISPECIES: hypothetical protein [Gammaproteobacteria]|uniref:Uncharacterized protein n=1 Tax=Vreelandella halophila TaxID=86177 RepID=A0A9X5B6E0_9GAMM|nr:MULTISPECIES: hypothetical protein [Gammaproteobacteria]KAA8982002.1 hypothetical protein F3089_09725 [Halospina sp. K52047b]MYL27373.1 hypothetical protein [Halomonas utahensis]MYL74499.1 hypothetical protein [Halomonas sp. 22501_18_FS]